MKISVCIAAFNEGPLLAGTVGSLVHQIKLPHEVIVVDDASTKSRSATRWLPKAIDGVPLTVMSRQTRKGPGPRKHEAADFASSDADAVIVMDAHMRPTDQFIVQVFKHLKQYPDTVFCPVCHDWNVPTQFAGCGGAWSWEDKGFWNMKWGPKREQADGPVELQGLLGGCYVIPKKILDEIGGYSPVLVGWGCEEEFLSARLKMAGYKIRLMADVALPHWFNTQTTAKRPKDSLHDGIPERAFWASRHLWHRICFPDEYREVYRAAMLAQHESPELHRTLEEAEPAAAVLSERLPRREPIGGLDHQRASEWIQKRTTRVIAKSGRLKPLRAVVTSTPRSGTWFVHRLINELGAGLDPKIKAFHEYHCNPVGQSLYCPNGQAVEVSWFAALGLNRLHDDTDLIHLRRHPLDNINSILRHDHTGVMTKAGTPAWNLPMIANMHVQPIYAAVAHLCDNPLDRVEFAQRFWLHWHHQIEQAMRIKEYMEQRHAWWKIETLNSHDVLEFFPEFDGMDIDGAIERLRGTSDKNALSRVSVQIGWDDLYPEIQKIAVDWGYEPPRRDQDYQRGGGPVAADADGEHLVSGPAGDGPEHRAGDGDA